MIIYCIRHGESAFNAEGRIQGQKDVPLSELGRRQSEALAAGMEGLGIEIIFASPLERAMQTARPVSRRLGVSIRTEPQLMELNAGIFQGLTWDEIVLRYPDEARRWKSCDPDYRIPGGESRRELVTRATAAFELVREAGFQRAAVIAHGGMLIAAFKGLLGIPIERSPFELCNGSISSLAWTDQPKLCTLNQTDHLRANGAVLDTRAGDL